MATINIPEAEAARNIEALIAQARAGVEVVIEQSDRPAVVLRVADGPYVRLLSESLRLAREHGSTATLDGDFGRDLEDAMKSHCELMSSQPPRRTIEDCIALLRADSPATIDEDFQRDVEAAIAAHREPLDSQAWA